MSSHDPRPCEKCGEPDNPQRLHAHLDLGERLAFDCQAGKICMLPMKKRAKGRDEPWNVHADEERGRQEDPDLDGVPPDRGDDREGDGREMVASVMKSVRSEISPRARMSPARTKDGTATTAYERLPSKKVRVTICRGSR